ncbi:hypothetical protein BC826DRAFT_665150 [Russula brevipes]|nr:hypothetical protein BC826DRAFT_665150 [Russula brevipes]
MASSSANTVLFEELMKHFGSTPGCDDHFIERCVELCRTFALTPEDLYFKWESIVLAPSAIGTRYIDSSTSSTIKSALQSELTKAAAAAQSIKIEPGLRKPRGSGPANMLGLGSRKNMIISGVGLVEATPTSQPSFAIPRSVGKAGISERSEALDERIDELANLVRQHYGLADLGDPSASTDLNEPSLHIESSRGTGSGVRFPLKFMPNFKVRGGPKGQGSVGLFPGAIVAVKGRNGGGGWFSVFEVLTLPPLLPSIPSTLRSEALKQEHRDTSFSVTIACGPFTPDSDLSFKPWSALLKNLASLKPSVVLLIGPFLDSNNEKIKNGDADQLPTELFHTHFTENLHDFVEASPSSLVLLSLV